MTTTTKRTSTFSDKSKKALAPGAEITENGLIYRKRKDGFGTWRYDFTQSGERFKGVIGADRDGITLSQARDIISEIRAKAITHRVSGLTGRSTQTRRMFSEVAAEFMTWGESHYQEHRHNISRMRLYLLPRFGNKQLGDITTAMVENMRAELRSEGLSSQTVQRITSLLAGTFKFAQKSDPSLDLPTDRLSRVKYQNQEVTPFTQEETTALLDAGCVQYDTITRGNRKGEKTVNQYKTKEFRVIVGLALFAGLRASEALGLDWRHVDFERGTILIRQVAKEGQLRDSTKSYKTRTVPISKSLKPLLEDLFIAHQNKAREEGLVLSRDGSKPYNQIQAMFGRIRGQAGLGDGRGYHVLRHTFATRAAENNVDIPTLQKLLGHSSVTVTMKYVHTTQAHLEASAKKLD